MKILALDPGYDRCGIALLDTEVNGKEVLVDSSCFVTDKSDDFIKRLFAVTSEVRGWIQKHAPDVCVLETLFFAKNQKTAMRVSETRGALLLTATELGVPVREFTPKQVKIAVTGDGSATKQQVTMMVQRLISIEKEVRYDDEYDAVAVGITASAILRNPQFCP